MNKHEAKSLQTAATPIVDVATLRARARQHLEDGAITESYRANREQVLRMLDEALATELVCVLRYKRHAFMAQGINAEAAAQEFRNHAQQEMDHADRLAARILQLRGEPDFNPATLSERSHAEYIAGADLGDMIKENLVAERIAIASYTEMISFIGDTDITTRRLLEEILAVEEEHADDMVSLLSGIKH